MTTVKEILKQEKAAVRVAALSGMPEAPALHAKAVSIAAAIRDGTTTAGLVKAFLQADIPGNIPDREPASAMTAAGVKTASAFAIIKAMSGMLDDDPMAAGKRVDEYLDLRRRAGKAGLEAAIISPPGPLEPIAPGLEDLSVELYRMVFVDSIEDPIAQWRALRHFIAQDSRDGLVAKKGDPDWNYR